MRLRDSGVNLPRIEVRIGEQSSAKHKNLLGCCDYLKIIKSGLQKMLSIWVRRRFEECSIPRNRSRSLHGTQHDESCPLMCSALNEDAVLNKEDCLKHLLKYQRWL